MSHYYLAHLNVVRPLTAFSPETAEVKLFFSMLLNVFGAAAKADGLKWHRHGIRSIDGSYVPLMHAMELESKSVEENPHILTMGGWTSLKAMHGFTYRHPIHIQAMKELRHWVDRTEGPTMVMWWAPAGKRVSLEDGWSRLQMLRANGPSPEAFTLQERFPAPDRRTLIPPQAQADIA